MCVWRARSTRHRSFGTWIPIATPLSCEGACPGASCVGGRPPDGVVCINCAAVGTPPRTDYIARVVRARGSGHGKCCVPHRLRWPRCECLRRRALPRIVFAPAARHSLLRGPIRSARLRSVSAGPTCRFGKHGRSMLSARGDLPRRLAADPSPLSQLCHTKVARAARAQQAGLDGLT